MSLAEQKLGELESRLAAGGGRSGEGAPRLRVVGDLGLLPPAVATAAARAVLAGARRSGGRAVNVALAYTGREDCAQAAARARQGVTLGWLHATDVDARLLRACLHTSRQEEGLPPSGGRLQLLLRSSGEQRLSDFALVQAARAQLHFVAPLWPDITFGCLAAALLRYQAAARGARDADAASDAAADAWDDARRLAALRGAPLAACASEPFEARFGGAPGGAWAAQEPPTEAEAAALRALAAGRPRRVAAFLAERERALWAWNAAAAAGQVPPWPPPLRARASVSAG
jgi:undecaprenyl diphosphate synthase